MRLLSEFVACQYRRKDLMTAIDLSANRSTSATGKIPHPWVWVARAVWVLLTLPHVVLFILGLIYVYPNLSSLTSRSATSALRPFSRSLRDATLIASASMQSKYTSSRLFFLSAIRSEEHT